MARLCHQMQIVVRERVALHNLNPAFAQRGFDRQQKRVKHRCVKNNAGGHSRFATQIRGIAQ